MFRKLHLVDASGQTARYIGRQDPVLRRLVQAFEECKVLRVRQVCRVERVNLFDDDVGVAWESARTNSVMSEWP